MRKQLLLICSITAVSLSLACGQTTPTSPAVVAPESTNAGPDGSTLKVLAPTLDGAGQWRPDSGQPVLAVHSSDGQVQHLPGRVPIELETERPALASIW